MRLQSLEIEHFRAVQSAQLQFGPALNVIYGPNDRGKSTIAEAIRAALLITPGSAESRSFVPWDAAAGQFPRVVLTFECEGATWRVEKVFATGSRAKAHLLKSTDGGSRFHEHAQGRNVEGKLREFLNWGHAAPGGEALREGRHTSPPRFLAGRAKWDRSSKQAWRAIPMSRTRLCNAGAERAGTGAYCHSFDRAT